MKDMFHLSILNTRTLKYIAETKLLVFKKEKTVRHEILPNLFGVGIPTKILKWNFCYGESEEVKK